MIPYKMPNISILPKCAPPGRFSLW